MTVPNAAYAAQSATSGLAPWHYTIREPLEDEILMKVKYSGICHSDVHMAKNDWAFTRYPCVPGHEFVGIAVKVGDKVTKFKVGDHVGIGCLVGSCKECTECASGYEQFCQKSVDTYAGETRGERTFGGYGKYVVCREDFVLKVPDNLPLDRAAPLLCAGITTYSPIMHNKMNRGGLKIGVIGLGGLGHMALQFGVAFNNEVYVISRSANKEALAKQLGAKGLILSTDAAQMKEHASSFNYLIDTVSAEKPVGDYLNLLRPLGIMVTVGAPPVNTTMSVPSIGLILGGRSIQGSLIGGIKETQEMLDFCSEKMILPMTEKVPCSYVNEAYDRVEKSDVMFRFVLDVEATCPEVPNAPY